MEGFARLCLIACGAAAFCIVHIAESRLVGDPEMMAAGKAGLIEDFTFDMKERGRTRCPRSPNRRFRTIDGTCNNDRNEGSSNTPLRRLVGPPAYEDDVGEPRSKSVDGGDLPNPREVSQVTHPDVPNTDDLTVLFMQWGQFIDHDVALSPLPTESGIEITCCGTDNRGLAHPQPEECFPIRFDKGDPDFDGNCMEFVRSEPALEDYGTDPRWKVREQLNALTSFVDASMVYGSEPEVARAVREDDGRGILLKVTSSREGDLLPKQQLNNCVRENPEDFCFLAGDIRVNEQPGLITLHTIFVRLHNLIATQLQENRPRRSRTFIFETARKIVGGITQNILYGEWLPILLGSRTMNRMALSTGSRSQYVPSLDPSVLTEFSTAAYRMGHSLVPNALLAGSTSLRLRDHFLRPQVVRHRFNDIAQGLVNGSAEVTNVDTGASVANRARVLDQFVSQELTEHLFERRPKFGFDLVSFNIQRGRDHGLRSFNDVRRACGLGPIFRFSDTSFNGSALSAVYSDPDDIDLFVGGLLEPPVAGGLVGPTFNCIIANQFFLLKHGDRYFFETNQRPEGFHDRQLDQIRKVTMSMVMCLTTDIRLIQPNAFQVASPSNTVMDCSQILLDWGDLEVF